MMKVRPWAIPIVALVVLLAVMMLAACSNSTTTQTATQTATQTQTQTATTTGTVTSTATQTTTKTTTSTSTSATTTKTTTKTTTTSEGTPQTGGVLRIIWSTGPGQGWGTPTSIFGGEGAYGDMAMEPLYDTYYPSGDFVSRLGVDNTVSPDGKTITIKLRQGVLFHDDTPFNAAAVIYNFDKAKAAGKMSANFLGVTAVNDYTVQFNFAQGMNINFASVVGFNLASPTFWAAKGDAYAAYHACGTGPYMQTDYQEGSKVTFARWDKYWGQKGYLDGIECTFIGDPVTQVMAMQAGQGDVTHSRDAKTMHDLATAGFNVIQDYMGMEAMNFNSRDTDSPFYDVRVRQAFEYAINKDPIISTLGYGYWERADQMQIPGMSGYLENLVPRTYNPDKARSLLNEAGWSGGFDTTFVHGVWDFNDGIASMQADLADVQINAKIEGVQFGQWATMRQQGWKGVFVAGSGMIVDFNNTLWTYFKPGGTEMYSIIRTPELNNLVMAAVTAIPKDAAKTNAASQYIYDQCLWAAIEHHGDNYAYTDKVHGINFASFSQWGQFDAEKAWLSK